MFARVKLPGQDSNLLRFHREKLQFLKEAVRNPVQLAQKTARLTPIWQP